MCCTDRTSTIPDVPQGGVFSFISVDCGLRVGDREALSFNAKLLCTVLYSA